MTCFVGLEACLIFRLGGDFLWPDFLAIDRVSLGDGFLVRLFAIFGRFCSGSGD